MSSKGGKKPPNLLHGRKAWPSAMMLDPILLPKVQSKQRHAATFENYCFSMHMSDMRWKRRKIKVNVQSSWSRGFIKGQAPSKLTSCERNLAINLPGCFGLLFLLSFIRKTKNARLKNPTDLLYKNLMKPLSMPSFKIDKISCC